MERKAIDGLHTVMMGGSEEPFQNAIHILVGDLLISAFSMVN